MAQTETIIRPASITDAADLAHIYAETWQATWQGIFPQDYIDSMTQRRNALWWAKNLKRAVTPPPVLYVQRDVVAGYISFGKSRYGDSGFEGEIYELNVRPQYQGVGIGTKLFGKCRETLEAGELIGLLAWSLKINERCCQFYEGRGGKPWERSVVRFGSMGTVQEYARIAYVWPPYDEKPG